MEESKIKRVYNKRRDWLSMNVKNKICENCSLEWKYGNPFHLMVDYDGYEDWVCNYCFESAVKVSMEEYV